MLLNMQSENDVPLNVEYDQKRRNRPYKEEMWGICPTKEVMSLICVDKEAISMSCLSVPIRPKYKQSFLLRDKMHYE